MYTYILWPQTHVCWGRLTPVAWGSISVTFLRVFHCRWAVLLPQKVCNTQNDFPPENVYTYIYGEKFQSLSVYGT